MILSLGTIDILGQIILCCGGDILSVIECFYPQDGRGASQVYTKMVSRYSNFLGSKLTPVETQCINDHLLCARYGASYTYTISITFVPILQTRNEALVGLGKLLKVVQQVNG